MKHTLVLEDLNCAHCAAKIETKIAETEGYDKVSFNFATKKLSFESENENPAAEIQAICDSIEDGVTVKPFAEHSHEHHEHHEHSHDGHCGHDHEHTHEHEHSHEHSHHHRGLKEIYEIIDSGNLTENANKLAKRIFEILAEAESKAHGISKEEVHFHEVGAIDSIVDVIAAAVCFDDLGYTDVVIPYLNEGRGTVRCQHGILPVPVPAVTNIVANHGLNLSITSINGELVTPTGAAIAAAIMTTDTLPEKFKIRKVGYGAGKREYERPGFVRGMEIE